MIATEQIPYNAEAERNILAACLVLDDAIIDIAPKLKPDDFYVAENRKIYNKMLEMADRREKIDMVTLAEKLPGMSAKIVELANSYIPCDISQHIQIIRDNSYLRQMLKIARNLIAKAQAKEFDDIGKFKAEVEEQILSLHAGMEHKLSHIREVMSAVVDAIEQRQQNGKMRGLKTYLEPLDIYISGMQPSDFIILAARPSMGKTSLGLQIGLRNALDGKHVYIATLEMSKEQLAERMLMNLAKVDGTRLKLGNLHDGELLTIAHYSGKIAGAPIVIDETSTTVTELRANTRRVKALQGLDLLIVDYLQLMTGPGDSRVQEVSNISRGLKLLARDLGVPVIAISQLSRAVETRKDREPQLSDLRDSGSLEQDADIVIFIYRDEYYNPGTDKPGRAKLIIAKHRNGPTGAVEVSYDKHTMRFYYDWMEDVRISEVANSAKPEAN